MSLLHHDLAMATPKDASCSAKISDWLYALHTNMMVTYRDRGPIGDTSNAMTHFTVVMYPAFV